MFMTVITIVSYGIKLVPFRAIEVTKITKVDFYRSPRLASSQKNTITFSSIGHLWREF